MCQTPVLEGHCPAECSSNQTKTIMAQLPAVETYCNLGLYFFHHQSSQTNQLQSPCSSNLPSKVLCHIGPPRLCWCKEALDVFLLIRYTMAQGRAGGRTLNSGELTSRKKHPQTPNDRRLGAFFSVIVLQLNEVNLWKNAYWYSQIYFHYSKSFVLCECPLMQHLAHITQSLRSTGAPHVQIFTINTSLS